MDFMHYDLGTLPKGHFVEVALQGNFANVRLLNDEGFQKYKDGDAYYFVGGLVKMSPVYLCVPQAGRWHLAVDVEGLNGSVTSSVRLLRMPPPAMQNVMNRLMYHDGVEVTEVIYNAANALKDKYDLFIACVTEDRNEVARPLASLLQQRGLRAGVEEFEIKDGVSPIEALDKGMDNCRCGIFIISPAMLNKRWREYEWESVTAKVVRGGKPVFVIWHKVGAEEIALYSESLSEKPARWTGWNTLESIAEEIADIIIG